MKRKILLSISALILAVVLLPAVAFANDIGVTINGTAVYFGDQAPVIVDGRTLVPLRAVFEALGFVLGWTELAQTATLDNGEFHVRITIGNEFFTVNNERFALDVPAQIIGGRTLLPIRAVLEAVGYYVEWDAATQTVLVASEPFAIQSISPGWLEWFDTTYAEFAAMGNFVQEGSGSGGDYYNHPRIDGASLVFSWDDWNNPNATPRQIFVPTRLWLGVDEISVRDALEMLGDEAYLFFDDYFERYVALMYSDGFVFSFNAEESDSPVRAVRIERGQPWWLDM